MLNTTIALLDSQNTLSNHWMSALGVLRDLQLLGYVELGACQTRGHEILDVARFCMRYEVWNIMYRYTM